MLNETQTLQIKKVLRESIDKNEVAGGNLLIIKNGNELLYHEDGFADKEAEISIKRDSIFRLFSLSKPITAAATMILLERGGIDLYEPVSKFLPSFRNQMVDENGALVPTEREVIIKDLLSMTSGLVYGGDNKAGRDTEELLKEIDSRMFGSSPLGTVEAMNMLGKCALTSHPGTAWNYGLSADVLGAVIEVVSGISFGEFLKKELFLPLKMEDTGFWLPEEKQSRLVKAYEEDEKGGLALYKGNHLCIINQMDRKPAFESGGAGLVSTIDDYARFAKMLLNDGSIDDVQILRPKTVKYLTTATLNAAQHKNFDLWITQCGYSYGNLMRVMVDSSRAGDIASEGEYGWDGWLGAYLCNCPKDNLTFLFMMQKTNAGTTSLTRKLRNIILSS